jgi:peptide/nickel transport system permease protein
MFKYALRRAILAIPVLVIISFVLFALLNLTGDPISALGGRQPPSPADQERLRKAFGLDRSLPEQYLTWLIGNEWYEVEGRNKSNTRYGILRGDFGQSFKERRPVIDVIRDKMGNTLLLMVTAEVVIVVSALFIGILSAVKQYSFWDNLFTTFSFVTYSVPVFLMAYVLMYIFAIQFRQMGLPYLPSSGMFDPLKGPIFSEIVSHLVLPVLTISLISIAGYSRYIRSAMLEVIKSDYMRTARSKGISERRILFIHGFKNASLPFVTLIGLDLPFLLAGAVVTETIFAWPGMGLLYIQSLERNDFAVLMAALMLIAVAVVIFQILTDIVYSLLDPRIRLS